MSTKLDSLTTKFSEEVSINVHQQGVDLHNIALKTNDLLVSWINLYVKEKTLLKRLHRKMVVLIHDLKMYYLGRASPEVYAERPLNDRILKVEVETYLKADPQFLKLKEEIDDQESVVELCEKAVEMLKTRAFLIKDAIRYLEFVNGL
ncbi:MAG: recombination mediator protein UvsY [Patescibacteria group bacterium]|nr:recombination mediator protein UvsY [Patescibacteria group bacterium]